MPKKIYLAKAPQAYINNVKCLTNTTNTTDTTDTTTPIKAVYYIIKPKHHLNAVELHIVSNQPNGNFFQPDLEGPIIGQYPITVSKLFAKYSNNLNAIGMKAGSTLQDFITFINQNISLKNPVSGNTDIWAVEYNLNTPLPHNYIFNGNGQLQPVPIIAYI